MNLFNTTTTTTSNVMTMLDKTKMKKDSSSDVPDHFLCSIRWVK